MTIEVIQTTIKNVLTRTTGFLRTVTSHSLQPYRGCTFGNSLCGIGCYVQHNGHVLKGRRWGDFLEVRTNAAESYLANCDRERRWSQRRGVRFAIFCSSSTDPFVPQESRFRITHSILTAMLDAPPDCLILQTHTHRVVEYVDLYVDLAARCDLRIHVSIESDRDRLPGLPPPVSSVEQRLDACQQLQEKRLRTVITVAPLLPMADPDQFFKRVARVADAVVIDHFIQGDGSSDGSRTRKTLLPDAMRAVCDQSLTLDYRDRIVDCAKKYLPGKVGVNIDGFAGRYQ